MRNRQRELQFDPDLDCQKFEAIRDPFGDLHVDASRSDFHSNSFHVSHVRECRKKNYSSRTFHSVLFDGVNGDNRTRLIARTQPKDETGSQHKNSYLLWRKVTR